MSTSTTSPSTATSPSTLSSSVPSAPALFAGPTVLPFVLIVLANVGGYFHLLPVFVQLLINSCACVYLGTIMSTKLKRSSGDNIEV